MTRIFQLFSFPFRFSWTKLDKPWILAPALVPHPSGGLSVSCSGPHPSGGFPLRAVLERFARDSFKPCQTDPICGLLSRTGLADAGLIMGIAAESADVFPSELRAYATTTNLITELDLLGGPLRIVRCHARATAALRSKGIRPGTSDLPDWPTRDRDGGRLARLDGGIRPVSSTPTGLRPSVSGSFSHRLNISAVSQSNRGGNVWGRLKAKAHSPPNTANASCENEVSQPNKLEDRIGAFGAKLGASQSSTFVEPGIGNEFPNKPGYIKREKFMTMEERFPPTTRKPKRPRLGDLQRTGPISAIRLVRLSSVAAQLLVGCSNVEVTDVEFGELVLRSLSNRCKTETARPRACCFVQDFLEFSLHRVTPLPFCGSAARPPSPSGRATSGCEGKRFQI